MEQIREKIFDRIIIGLIVISLAGTPAVLITRGFSSSWSWGALLLLPVALIAFALRTVGKYVVAAYALVLGLSAVVAGMLLQTNAVANFTPYLFIPIVIIAGLILSPLAPIITAIISIGIAVILAILSGQLTPSNLMLLLPPLGLVVVTALLVAESGRQAGQLNNLMLKNKQLLRDRTWETLEALKEAEQLKQKATQLERQLLNNRNGTSRPGSLTAPQSGLYDLLEGAVEELNLSLRDLSRVVDQVEEELTDIARQPGLLEEIWQRIDHLTNLVVNLEEMSQLENDQVSLQFQVVDIARLITEAVGTARGLAREKNLEIRERLPEDLPELYIDPNRVRQAILHVLSNAVNYTDEGVIEVQTKLSDQELVILISDTGIGIDQAEKELVFQRFGRSSSPLAKPRQGSGLGLALSDRLMNLHGGRIWVSSIPGTGSTFYLSLPLMSTPDKVLPQPEPANLLADREATIVSRSQSTVTALSTEDALPLISRETDVTVPQVRRNLGPVSRLGTTYSNRLGLVLWSLLLVLAFTVLALVIFGQVGGNEQIVVNEPTLLSTVGHPSPAKNVVVKSTSTPTVTFQPSAAITTSLPTETPTVWPTNTSLSVTSTLTNTFTPTAAPTEVLVVIPTPLVTATPLPLSTAVFETEEAIVPPTTIVSATAMFKPRRLSFMADSASGPAIGLRTLDGSPHAGLLTIDTAYHSGLSWSPQGQLVFTTDRHGDRELYRSQTDGSQAQRLTQVQGDDTQPAWSPDGRKIAFSSGRTGNFDIYVIDADGSHPVQLTTSRGFDEWPVWSPDGRKIAFVSDRDGNVEIYTMNADGSQQQRLTNHQAEDWPATWSPDGRQLVFASTRDSNWNLYLIDATGGNLVRLTNDPANEREPAWSPDGQTITFAYDGYGNWDIYALSISTNSPTDVPRGLWTQITDTPGDERYPVWLP